MKPHGHPVVLDHPHGEALAALLQEAVAAAGEAEVLLYARARDRGFARFAQGELGQHMHVLEPEVIARVARGSRLAEASTTRLERSAIVSAIRHAADLAERAPERSDFPGFLGADDVASGDAATPPRFDAKTANTTAEDRVERLAPVLRAVRDAGLVSAGALETALVSQAVVTSRGLSRAHDATLAAFRVWALETPGAGGASGFGGQMHRAIDALDLARETERAIRIARLSKDPSHRDAGAYDVVFEPEAFAELLEWLATIAFAAPDVEQGTSPLAGRFGETITGERVTIVEDPLDESDLGFGAPFDREGVSRERVTLVERGVARGVLYDRATAKRMGARSTGSSVVAGFGAEAGVAPTCLALDAGDAESVDALVRGVKRGLYVCRLHYVNGFIEPRRAVMTGLTRDGCFLIENGAITRPVGNLRFTDSLLEALGRCDGMTRTRTAVPTWWSDGGATLTPAVRIRGFRFTGGSQPRPDLGAG
jgi:predicted Zn-dependent protease